MQFITGLLIASLWVIWPFQQRTYEMVGDARKLVASTPVLPDRFDAMLLLSLLLFLAGCAAVFVLHYLVEQRLGKRG
jgi:hypothetical protein